jgi:hypothetical protein
MPGNPARINLDKFALRPAEYMVTLALVGMSISAMGARTPATAPAAAATPGRPIMVLRAVVLLPDDADDDHHRLRYPVRSFAAAR